MNYFKESESILKLYPEFKKAKENIKKKIARLEKIAAPNDIPNIDFNKPFVSGGAVNDTFKDLCDYNQAIKELEITENKIKIIENTVALLSADSRKVIELCFFENLTIEEIAEKLEKWSNTTVYNKRNKAVAEFMILYFGAAAENCAPPT